jgi:hypothetical protein
VGDSNRRFDLLTILREIFSTGRARRDLLMRSLPLLIVLGLLGCGAATAVAAGFRTAKAASFAPRQSFAIADFDGDHHPDLATVETGGGDSSFTRYSIQLQLSGAGRQSIPLVAPIGGLVIEARDVNGDHAVDLVLATAWLRHPVAIFLNDGKGRFSRTETTAFPQAFAQSTVNWSVSSPDQLSGAMGVPPQHLSRSRREAMNLPDVRGPTQLVRAGLSGFPPDSLLTSQAGRAPPSEVFHS